MYLSITLEKKVEEKRFIMEIILCLGQVEWNSVSTARTDVRSSNQFGVRSERRLKTSSNISRSFYLNTTCASASLRRRCTSAFPRLRAFIWTRGKLGKDPDLFEGRKVDIFTMPAYQDISL